MLVDVEVTAAAVDAEDPGDMGGPAAAATTAAAAAALAVRAVGDVEAEVGMMDASGLRRPPLPLKTRYSIRQMLKSLLCAEDLLSGILLCLLIFIANNFCQMIHTYH